MHTPIAKQLQQVYRWAQYFDVLVGDTIYALGWGITHDSVNMDDIQTIKENMFKLY